MKNVKKPNPEVVGFGSVTLGAACLGWFFAGPLLAVAAGLIVLGAVLILVGNA